MKTLTSFAIAGVAALMALSASSAAAAGDWKTLRNGAGDYSVRYPADLTVGIPSGRSCTGDVCQTWEVVNLAGPAASGGVITLSIQRNMNPKHLPMRDLYESRENRPLSPDTERVVTIGGREAVRRRLAVRGVITRFENGREVSRRDGMIPDDTTILPLNDSDVLWINITPSSSPAVQSAFEEILNSVKFSH